MCSYIYDRGEYYEMIHRVNPDDEVSVGREVSPHLEILKSSITADWVSNEGELDDGIVCYTK